MGRTSTIPFFNSSNVQEIPVATTDVVYTKVVDLSHGEYFSLAYKATSPGNVKLKIELEQSHYKLTEAEEGSAHATYTETIADVNAALADELWHIVSISPICLPYARLKITGLADPLGNDADTTIAIFLGKKEM